MFIEKQTLNVNSYHGYGIKRKGLAECLDVTAVDKSGFVEGARHRKYSMEGIMWHPERESPYKKFDIKLIKNIFKKSN